MPIELIAVHISDGVLSNFWHGIGFVAAIVLIFAGSWRLQDREIASLALLTTIFFLASSLRVPLGPSSVHLLLNGLLGILIGMRSSIAIAIGLVLQCLLAGHGGVTTLGINICAITIPAYLGCYFYYIGLRVSSYFPKATKFILVFSAILFWGFSVVFGIELFYLRLNGIVSFRNFDPFVMWSLQPLFLISFFFVSIIAVRIFHQQSISIHFSLGLLLGTVTVMLTSLLNCLILLFCGNAEWSLLAISVFLAHLPLAALEGVIVGVIVMYLQVTKSQLLPFHNVQRGNNSSNGISH